MDISDLYFALKHIWTCSCFILEFYIYQTSSSIVYWRLISVEHIYYLLDLKSGKTLKSCYSIFQTISSSLFNVQNYRYVCNIEMRLIIPH